MPRRFCHQLVHKLLYFFKTYIPLGIFNQSLENNYSVILTFFCIFTIYVVTTFYEETKEFVAGFKDLLYDVVCYLFYYADQFFNHSISYYSVLVLYLVLECLKYGIDLKIIFDQDTHQNYFIGSYFKVLHQESDFIPYRIHEVLKNPSDLNSVKNCWKFEKESAYDREIMLYILKVIQKLSIINVNQNPKYEELCEKTALVISLAWNKMCANICDDGEEAFKPEQGEQKSI